jgi:hypothetical protein
MICERALGLIRGQRLEFPLPANRMRLEALDYEGLISGGAQEEAIACARHFPGVRDGLFNAYPWTFARRSGYLTSAGGIGAMVGWRHVFLMPDDCVKLHELVLPHGTTPGFEVVGNLIGCDARDPVARYSAVVTDTDEWPMLFQDAFCGRLAWEMALAVTGSPELGAGAFQLFQFAISEGYRTGLIDPGARVDNNMASATRNTARLYSPAPDMQQAALNGGLPHGGRK